MCNDTLSGEELLYLNLKALYEGFGYARFQMRRFEEYSLYADNLNFLKSRDIITFGGRDGRLLALKPDVTLSIVKNCKGAKERVRKVYYRESVYRTDRPGGQFREINQIGLECVGELDFYAGLEVLYLAAESLKAVGGGYVMDISHMGALEGIAESCGMASLPEEVMACVRSRNLHDMKTVCMSCGMGEDAAGKLRTLLSANGSNAKKLTLLRSLFPESEKCLLAAGELEGLLAALGDTAGAFEVDFSLLNDPAYYNGVIFQGYVDKFPRAVLSGGRYDNLVTKFGAGSGGAGFALYPDELGFYMGKSDGYDADCLVLYGEDAPAAEILRTVKELFKSGKTAFAAGSLPEGKRFGEIIKL